MATAAFRGVSSEERDLDPYLTRRGRLDKAAIAAWKWCNDRPFERREHHRVGNLVRALARSVRRVYVDRCPTVRSTCRIVE